MTLILTVRNPDRLAAGAPKEFKLDQTGGTIGRAGSCDWALPDPDKHISSRHCEISYDGKNYVLKDISTNGTFLNGASDRMASERPIEAGDRFRIGPLDVEARLDGGAAEETTKAIPPQPAPAPVAEPAPPPPPPPPAAAPTPAPAAVEPEPAGAETTIFMDSALFAEMTEANKVDWERGGFGAAPTGPVDVEEDAGAEQLVVAMATAAGVDRAKLQGPPSETIVRAGALLKRLTAALVVMVEARARAKAQMGAEATQLQLDGNNPIKFARTPEGALAQILSPVQKGFLDGEKAVEDAYLDVQAHQFATIAAIPGALRTTLERFSPGSIKRRAATGGILDRIITSRRDAALWAAYEREFGEVANQSDDAFMQVFSREFRKVYTKQIEKQPQKR